MKAETISFSNIDMVVHVSSATIDQTNGPVNGNQSRQLVTKFTSPEDLVPIKECYKDLNIPSVDWASVLNSVFYCINCS